MRSIEILQGDVGQIWVSIDLLEIIFELLPFEGNYTLILRVNSWSIQSLQISFLSALPGSTVRIKHFELL